MPPSGAPLSPGSGPNNPAKPPAAVAIVTPQRSNSLDFLNFEEKRQLIASSLSLTDFLHHGGSATSPSSPTSGNVYIGEAPLFCQLIVASGGASRLDPGLTALPVVNVVAAGLTLNPSFF
ncbi:protein phosphatase inhibitor activity protein [Homalodisca vitripennis]|nr:protein phosphatase inhibitor activity protein [Homalodisca vitripennis]